MIFKLYILATLAVFGLAIGPFLRDPSNPKTQLSSWLFLALAMALSPITLPNMLWQRCRSLLPGKPRASRYSASSIAL